MPARSVAELLPKPFDELTDDRRELIGGPAPGGEIELWVKDVLRSRVLPLPPFRARQLNLENGQVVLLILVPSSSTTPHLRRLHGAISLTASRRRRANVPERGVRRGRNEHIEPCMRRRRPETRDFRD